MGISQDYPNVPDWVDKPEGYPTGSMVKYNGNVFYANFWASKPGDGNSDTNGWRLYDELYDLTSHKSTEPPKIIAYIPTWRKREGFNYKNSEMYRYITHGVIAFLMFSEINLGEFEPGSVKDVHAILEDVIETGHQNGTKILIGLGGATDYGFLNLMTSIGNNPDSPLLDQAVQNVVSFVTSNNLDGVDLDLECWWDKNGDASKDQGGRSSSQGAHPAGYALTLFAQKLKQELKKAMPRKDTLVSAAVFGTSWYGNNYDPKLVEHVDWLGVMTYDLTGSWNSSPVGPHSALYKMRQKAKEPPNVTHSGPFQEDYEAEQQGAWPAPNENKSSSDPIFDNPILSVEDTLWYWTNPLFMNWQGAGQKVPRNKIAAGVPIYGYDFAYSKEPDDLSGQIPPGYKVIRYKDILAQFPNAHTSANGNIKVGGSTPRPNFISASGNYPYAHNIYFETPDTAVAKLNFLKNVGAQGVIIWELSNDVWEEGKSIIKALYRKSGNPDSRPPLPGKTTMPSDILVPWIERIMSYTNELAAEIDQGIEQETSRLGLLVEPSLLEPIERFLENAGKQNGKEIKREDADTFLEEWREIEKKAREYKVDSPDAPNQITDLKNKLDQLIKQVKSKLQSEDGWVVAPLLSLISPFQAHVLLEGFVRRNPANPDSNRDENKKQECELQANEASQKIQELIDALTSAYQRWPGMDLGPVGTVLGSTTLPEPTHPSPEPTHPSPKPTHPSPKPPIRLSSTTVDFAQGMLSADKNSGINLIAQKIITKGPFGGEVFTVFEIQTQEGCNMAIESLKQLEQSKAFLLAFVMEPSGWLLRLTMDLLETIDADDLVGDWTYQTGDRLFTYVVGGGGWADSKSLFVFKRNGQIYYHGNLSEDMFPKFQEYFNINPLS